MATPTDSYTHQDVGRWPSLIAVLLLVMILVVRIAVVLIYTPPVTNDAAGYEASAYRLATSHSFAYPTSWSKAWSPSPDGPVVDDVGRQELVAEPRNAFTMPGYPVYRALIFKISGDGDRWRTWTRVSQAILSVFGALLIYLLARRYSERAGLIALLFMLLYQPLMTANSHLLTDVLFTYLLVTCVYCAVLWSEHRVIGRAAAVGVVLGLATWVRPTVLPWAVIAAVIALVYFRLELRRVALQIGIAGLIAVAIISPWWIRNYDVYQRFVPVSTSGNAAAIVAIQIDAAHQWPFPWQARGPQETPEQAAIVELADHALESTKATEARGDLAVSEVQGLQYKRLRSEVLYKYPVVVLRLRLRTILVALAQPYAFVRWSLAYAALTGILHYMLLGAAIAALFVFRRRIDTLLIASMPLYLIAIHAIIIPFNRYVFPAMPFAVILAAALLDQLASRRIARQSDVSAHGANAGADTALGRAEAHAPSSD